MPLGTESARGPHGFVMLCMLVLLALLPFHAGLCGLDGALAYTHINNTQKEVGRHAGPDIYARLLSYGPKVRNIPFTCMSDAHYA